MFKILSTMEQFLDGIHTIAECLFSFFFSRYELKEFEWCDTHCCTKKCFERPNDEVDGLACTKCYSFCMCRCKCRTWMNEGYSERNRKVHRDEEIRRTRELYNEAKKK